MKVEHLMKSESFSIGSAATALFGASKRNDILLKNIVTGAGDYTLDVNSWLPAASEIYQISPNISDYILVPVPSIITGLPNTNGDSVSVEELIRFDPKQGQLAYRTWKGKPTHIEHQNKVLSKAKGVILDVILQPITSHQGNHYKCVKLLGYDRTKDPALCDDILARRVNTYSMGFWFKSYTCSICNARVGPSGAGMCSHTNPKRRTYVFNTGQLAYRCCEVIEGFECSSVRDPAFVTANSDKIMDVRQFQLGSN